MRSKLVLLFVLGLSASAFAQNHKTQDLELYNSTSGYGVFQTSYDSTPITIGTVKFTPIQIQQHW